MPSPRRLRIRSRAGRAGRKAWIEGEPGPPLIIAVLARVALLRVLRLRAPRPAGRIRNRGAAAGRPVRPAAGQRAAAHHAVAALPPNIRRLLPMWMTLAWPPAGWCDVPW